LDTLQVLINFLNHAVLELYIMVVWLRLWLPLVNANFYNPICQLVVQLTDVFIRPLRRFLPRLMLFDLPVVLLLFALGFLNISLTAWAEYGRFFNIIGGIVWTVGTLLQHLVSLTTGLIILRVILSWLKTTATGSQMMQQMGAIYSVMYQLTEPLLRVFRRFLPNTMMIDLSPLIAFFAIQLGQLILIRPIVGYGMVLALS